jgi:dihydroxyacetone kinase-like protein
MALADPTDSPVEPMESALIAAAIEAVARAVVDHCDELTALDQAIGDGDHGINMKRGFEAVLDDLDELSQMPLPQALGSAGMKLVMIVGGASGPLYGTLLMALGKNLPADPTHRQLADGLNAAIEAVMARGKSRPGEKTLLDVLAPVQKALDEGLADPARLAAVARIAAEDTVAMKALKGRASYLGERSIGHMDPGARSSSLMIETLCNLYEGR